jgi:hypothetical protein
VEFEFRLGRGREGPRQFLGKVERILQTDGYVACEQVGGPKVVHACCWAHARRKFIEAHRVSPGESVDEEIVRRIDGLFAIAAEARAQGLDVARRDALRQREARTVLTGIRAAIEAAPVSELPASKLGRAITYALGLWPKLERFLEHPVRELSNNLAENSTRPAAVGRKNGSTWAAKRRGRRWRPFCRWWRTAGAWAST